MQRVPSIRLSTWVSLLKYLFSAALALFAASRVGDAAIAASSLIELALVFFLCNALARRSRVAATLVSGVALLFFDAQQLVLVFGNTYITLVMITNLDSLEDLSGKMLVYGLAIAAMVAFVFLPVRPLALRPPRALERLGGMGLLLFALCTADALLLDQLGWGCSPYFSYANLLTQHVESVQVAEEIKKQPNMTLDFYQASVADHRAKPAALPEQPNVVVIFTEGLSQSVVDDERAIMPNVARYEQESLAFSSYFNHTFATYRGLTGQMHSGYQHNNFDDTTLVSMATILAEQGYQTAFINTEPSNRDFYAYLGTLGFGDVLDYPDETHAGVVGNNLSDREAYDKLFEEMEARHGGEQPFLLGIYTFGTHASLDSPDERFGDGSDSELNKFYDADYQFGQFMERFVASDMYDDTLIVFTADHCTYADMYFSDAFPACEREHMELDAIPLFLYYKGVTAETIDVAGRNTLDFAPTLLDFLDVSSENYFLGTSLFAPNDEAGDFETFFNDGGASFASTEGGQVRKLADSEADELKRVLWHYYAAKQQEPLTPDEVEAPAQTE